MNKGAFWPIAIAGVLGVTVVANGFILYEANHGPTAVEPDYYRKAVDWDSTLAQETRNGVLGWQLTASLGKDGELAARLASASGAPIEGATISVQGFAIAYDGELTTDLTARPGAQYNGIVRLSHGGLHELRFLVRQGRDRFTAVLRGVPGETLAPKP